MYKVTLKARGQQFEYSCASNATPLRAAATSLFRFQQGVSRVDVACVR